MAYADVAYFAWPKFGTTGSTHSWDNLLSITFRPSGSTLLGARYRYRDKQNNQTQRGRLYATYGGRSWSCKTQCDMSYVRESEAASRGWMASQQAAYRWRWLRLTCMAGYFSTDDYAARIYASEPTLLYGTHFGSFFGRGMRLVLTTRADVGSHLVALCKVGSTKYFDRDCISSGLQQIDGSSQTDIEIQVKWRW